MKVIAFIILLPLFIILEILKQGVKDNTPSKRRG